MSQHYSDPSRADDPHALPDVEVFYNTADPTNGWEVLAENDGWFYWHCFPGCLPDGEPIGPFKTEAEAIADAQNNG